MLRIIEVARYVMPLREGGSLPAIVEATDGSRWVVKFRGAGQGARVLVAEVLAASLAQQAGLPVPAAALAMLAPEFGRAEPDPEIQDVLRASHGINFALAFLPSAVAFDPATDGLDPDLAADILWFDGWIANVDRSVRNANLLVSNGRVWLIDHGSAFYFHHRWAGWDERLQLATPTMAEHVLLPLASDLTAAHHRMRQRIDPAALAMAVTLAPDDWLLPDPSFDDAAQQREAYRTWLSARLAPDAGWLTAAAAVQAAGAPRLAARATHRDWDPA